jgi:hypothetical protein
VGKEARTMLKPYEVTVTYRLHAVNEADAASQVFNNRVEPETVDVLDLPIIPTPQIDIVDF